MSILSIIMLVAAAVMLVVYLVARNETISQRALNIFILIMIILLICQDWLQSHLVR